MVETDIIRAFSNASVSYEENILVQRACACDLLDMIDIPAPQNVLDLGCGTGLISRMLAERFPGAKILACDPSNAMLKEAVRRNNSDCVEFDCCGAGGLRDGCWDLIVSNAALHWVGNLEHTLGSLKSRLAPNGLLAFSYFTRNTYTELAQALSDAAGFDVKLPSSDFASSAEVEKIVLNYFPNAQVQRKVYSQDFADVRALLEHIKLTGTRGAGERPRLNWTRKLLEKTQREYIARFGCIRASYEVVLCTARQTQSL